MLKRLLLWLFQKEQKELQDLISIIRTESDKIKSVTDSFLQVQKNMQIEYESAVQANEVLIGRVQSFDEMNEKLSSILGCINASVDLSFSERSHSTSWAAISIQSDKTDFVKFVHLDKPEIVHIQQFLKQFEKRNITIDAPSQFSTIIKRDLQNGKY